MEPELSDNQKILKGFNKHGIYLVEETDKYGDKQYYLIAAGGPDGDHKFSNVTDYHDALVAYNSCVEYQCIRDHDQKLGGYYGWCDDVKELTSKILSHNKKQSA